VWKRFENLSPKSKKVTRNEIIQIRHTMEQYMIAVTQEDLEAANLEETPGIYRIAREDIERLYNQITGFIRPR
jgi:ABC-type sugar transport system ATPase subunit